MQYRKSQISAANKTSKITEKSEIVWATAIMIFGVCKLQHTIEHRHYWTPDVVFSKATRAISAVRKCKNEFHTTTEFHQF